MHPNDFADWVGREQRQEDVLVPRLVSGFRATLDHDEIEAREGEAAPQGIHWLLAPAIARARDLGADAHPALGLAGGLTPAIPLPRRMWAGSRVAFLQPLRIGERVERHSRIVSIRPKEGRSGPLVFLEVAHTWSGEAGLLVAETQSIVYRSPASDGAVGGPSAPPALESNWAWKRDVRPDSAQLFRYSALTFNGHRIHYDQSYAREIEGYPDLVVHGPLWATLLIDLCAHELGDQALRSFSFRARRPAFVDAPASLVGRVEDEELTLAALNAEGAEIVTAEAVRAR